MLEKRVLDKGIVKLVGFTVDLEDLTLLDWDDHEPSPSPRYLLAMEKGLDSQVVRAARASYTGGTKTKRKDAQLIRYLIQHEHWSPFEMVQLKFFIKAPLFVVQQFLRHRAFSFNQESARYSVLQDEYYIPASFRAQDTKNKQGSVEAEFDPSLREVYIQTVDQAFDFYRHLLDQGVAREMARMVLPSCTYTRLYVRGDLRNWLHFLKLRLDSHAQWETRQYAEAILELIRPLAPVTVAAWEELHARAN